MKLFLPTVFLFIISNGLFAQISHKEVTVQSVTIGRMESKAFDRPSALVKSKEVARVQRPRYLRLKRELRFVTRPIIRFV